jgi:hypothetical protein
MPAPTLRAYPKETVIAEKFHAMVTLGMANSRMKDLFDLWILCRSFSFSGQTLTDALRATFRRRKTELSAEAPIALTDAFAADTQNQTQWKAFVRRTDLSAKTAPLPDILATLRDFLLSPVQAAAAKAEFAFTWKPNGPWQPNK